MGEADPQFLYDCVDGNDNKLLGGVQDFSSLYLSPYATYDNFANDLHAIA